MASIVTTDVLIDRPHGSRRFLRIRYVWDTGDDEVIDSVVEQAQDVAAWVAARTPELEAAAVQAEINAVLGD